MHRARHRSALHIATAHCAHQNGITSSDLLIAIKPLTVWAVSDLWMTRCAGDRVVGQAAGCLGSHVIADAASLALLPHGLEPRAASTLPTAHLTAAAALLGAARVIQGDRQAARRADTPERWSHGDEATDIQLAG